MQTADYTPRRLRYFGFRRSRTQYSSSATALSSIFDIYEQKAPHRQNDHPPASVLPSITRKINHRNHQTSKQVPAGKTSRFIAESFDSCVFQPDDAQWAKKSSPKLDTFDIMFETAGERSVRSSDAKGYVQS
eukprot:6184055-Pleurochrysis_carterae.AAC.1